MCASAPGEGGHLSGQDREVERARLCVGRRRAGKFHLSSSISFHCVSFRFGFHFVVKMCGRPADLGRVNVADEDVSRGARPLQCQEARAKGETVFHHHYDHYYLII